MVFFLGFERAFVDLFGWAAFVSLLFGNFFGLRFVILNSVSEFFNFLCQFDGVCVFVSSWNNCVVKEFFKFLDVFAMRLGQRRVASASHLIVSLRHVFLIDI